MRLSYTHCFDVLNIGDFKFESLQLIPIESLFLFCFLGGFFLGGGVLLLLLGFCFIRQIFKQFRKIYVIFGGNQNPFVGYTASVLGRTFNRGEIIG